MWVILPDWIVVWRGILLCILLIVAPAHARAELRLDEAVVRTLERNPGLVSLGHQLTAQEGRVLQAGLRPNPELGLAVENFLGNGLFTGFDGVETTLNISWVLERGKRDRRVETALAGVSVLEADAEVQRLDAAADTALFFLASLAAQERLLQFGEAVSLSEEALRFVARRVNAGGAPDADLARAEADLARAQLSLEDLQHEKQVSNYQLAARWGDGRPDFTSVVGNVLLLPKPDAFELLLARVNGNPRIARLLSERHLRESELSLAEAEARPDWQFNAGIRRLELVNDGAFVTGINIPLAWRNRNQGRIAESKARIAQSDTELGATRLQIETRLFALYQELQHSLHRSSTMRDEVLPKSERALADTERAYESGRYGYFELSQVRQELLDARTELIEAGIEAHRAALEIERLTGTALDPSLSRP